jgi:murein DD-endopeptidase MepM/ murein hydrolase activator NlpD
MRSLPLLLLASIAVAAPDPEKAGRNVVQLLLDEKYDTALAQFADRSFGEKVVAMMRQVRSEAGPIKTLSFTGREEERGAARFAYKAEWTKGVPSEVKVWLGPDGKVVGFLLRNATNDSFDRYQTKTKLRPPFRESWTAHNATRDETNGHYTNPNQRFAVDWLITDDAKKTHQGDGKKNGDYFAYGKDALAVADGTVVTVVDGVPDNEPGQMDAYHVGGNEIVIDLGNGEFALYCHLIPTSMRVKVGQRVKSGDAIAKIGNSGNSSEPHLHFQLSDSPRLHLAHSLPAHYPNVVLDGKPVATAWPTTGQRMAPR